MLQGSVEGVRRPWTVTASFWSWVASAVFAGIGAYLLLTTAGSASDVQALDPRERDAAVAFFTGWAILAIVFALVRTVLAWFVLHAHRWARIVLAVLAFCSTLIVVLVWPMNGLFEWAAAASVVAASLFMFLPQSNEFFRDVRDIRRND